jgi:hypothetical protein
MDFFNKIWERKREKTNKYKFDCDKQSHVPLNQSLNLFIKISISILERRKINHFMHKSLQKVKACNADLRLKGIVSDYNKLVKLTSNTIV